MSVATLAGVTAVNAITGSIYGLGGAPNVPREWLDGSRFENYKVPSLILGFGVGGSSARRLSRHGGGIRQQGLRAFWPALSCLDGSPRKLRSSVRAAFYSH
jgi:hypothetical protein